MSPLSEHKLGIVQLSVMAEEIPCEGQSHDQRAVTSSQTDSKHVAKLSPHTSQSIADGRDEPVCELPAISDLIKDTPKKNCSLSKLLNSSMLKMHNLEELPPNVGLPCKSPASPCLKQNLTPSVTPLDREAAYKIVEELEDWKEKQQDIFLAEVCFALKTFFLLL